MTATTTTTATTLTATKTATADWLVAASLAPSTEGELAPLYAAALAGRLVLPFCGACTVALELEQSTCDACGAHEVVWTDVGLNAVVHTATTVHRREPGLIVHDGPYHVLDVQFPSGHRVLMTTTGPVLHCPEIGAPVRIGFRIVGDVAVPAVLTGEVVAPHPEGTP